MIEKAVNKDNIENEIGDMNDYEEVAEHKIARQILKDSAIQGKKRLNSAHWRRQEFSKGAT